MSRLRRRTITMSIATRPVVVPNSAACRATYATFALQISFLLGMQLTFGQEPPIHWRSTTAVRRPDRARCQASQGPPRCTGRRQRQVHVRSDGLARGVLRHPRESSAGDLSQFLSTHDSLAVHWNTFGRLKASGNHQAAMQSSEENAL